MAKINDVDITSLLFQEGTAPATPATTKWRLYTKTTGLFYKDDAGVETGPLAASTGSVPAPWVLEPHSGLANVGASTIGTNNAAYIVPATLYAAATITGMIIRVVVSSGNISVGLYDSSLARLATSGSVACPAIGHAAVNFTGNYSAAAGKYYLGISGSSSTASFVISGSTGTSASPVHGFTMATAHPLPDPFVNGGAARSYAIAGAISGGWTG